MRLSIETVSKTYRGGARALADFSLELGPGMLGLLGPNGAGKSTLMRILATITRPSAGRVLWNGEDVCRQPAALRSALGYLPQDFGIYPHLSAALGAWSGGSRLFEVVYLLLWYIGPLNRVRELDFMGVTPGARAGGLGWIYLGLAVLLLLAAVGGRVRQARS
jgi:hypothetical protein